LGEVGDSQVRKFAPIAAQPGNGDSPAQACERVASGTNYVSTAFG
jgi:hypothetical protein